MEVVTKIALCVLGFIAYQAAMCYAIFRALRESEKNIAKRKRK